MAADEDDRLRRPGQGQQFAVVLQQDDGALGVGLGRGGVRRIVDAGRLVAVQRLVEQAGGEHRAQDTVRHVVEALRLDPAIGHRLRQGVFEIGREVEGIARFLVQAGIGRRDRRMGGAPVRHDIALVVPVVLQHLVEQPVAFAGIGAIHTIVRTHHRAWLADLIGELEGQQVRLPRGLLADLDVDREAVGFLGVEGIVLQRRDDVVRLDALDFLANYGARQQRILTAVFEVAAVARLARQVVAAGQLHVEARHSRLVADHRAAREGQGRVPGRRRGDARRQRGAQARMRRPLGGHADTGIGLGLRRDAQARYAGDIARRVGHPVDRAGEVLPWRVGREVAEDQFLLFLGGHRLDQQVGAGVGIERRVHPRRGRLRGVLRQNGDGQAQRQDGGGQDQAGLQRHGSSSIEKAPPRAR